MNYNELSPTQIRVSVELRQTYDAYRAVKRHVSRYAGGMMWKTVSGNEYLIRITDSRGGNKSLGRRSPETERIYEEFVSGKARAKARHDELALAVKQHAGMARGVNINRAPAVVGATLRKLDEYGLLGKNIIVVGTNAMYAYESSAGVQFDSGLLATTDMDLLWDARTRLKLALLDDEVAEAGVLAVLQKVDRSFTPLRKGDFRAINDSGFFVDLIKQTPNPPWKKGEPTQIAGGDLTPSWIEKVKWLLSSEKFTATAVGQDGLPAPMVCPDPRAFAIYKSWLSEQADRDPDKKVRDRAQSLAVIELVQAKFPHLPLDDDTQRIFPKSVRVARPKFDL